MSGAGMKGKTIIWRTILVVVSLLERSNKSNRGGLGMRVSATAIIFQLKDSITSTTLSSPNYHQAPLMSISNSHKIKEVKATLHRSSKDIDRSNRTKCSTLPTISTRVVAVDWAPGKKKAVWQTIWRSLRRVVIIPQISSPEVIIPIYNPLKAEIVDTTGPRNLKQGAATAVTPSAPLCLTSPTNTPCTS